MNSKYGVPVSRRQMLRDCGCGFGYLSLAGLVSQLAEAGTATPGGALGSKSPRLPARAKRMIFVFMHGGPSQVDTFDYKPRLARDHGKIMPVKAGDLVPPNSKLLASPFEFAQYGDSGLSISSLFPQVAQHADRLCVIRSLYTDGQAHGQAVLKLHTGHETQLRPSMGSWVIHGLGTENQNLPGFITLSPSNFNGGPQNYGAAFLPAMSHGAAFC